MVIPRICSMKHDPLHHPSHRPMFVGSQVDVLNSAPPWQKLRLMPVLCMIFITAIYILKVAPWMPC